MTYHDGLEPPRQLELDETHVDQLGLCTRDEHCTAPADEHQPDCPVELRLHEELGF